MKHTRRSLFGLLGGAVSAALVAAGVKKRSSDTWEVKYPLRMLRGVTKKVADGVYETWRIAEFYAKDGRLLRSERVCVGRFVDKREGGVWTTPSPLGKYRVWDIVQDKPVVGDG